MPPSHILPQCLATVFDSLHASTAPVVLKAVDALSWGGWLTLTEVARHWPGAERVAAPLKATDRLLRSPVLTRARNPLYAAMVRWLVREAHPLVAVDWSDLKADGSFKLLRAGLVVQGRTLTLWEEVHPERTAGTAAVEQAFLHHLAQCLPAGCQPVVLSDAGFRRPWFRSVLAQGWDYVGRVRGTTRVQPNAAAAANPAEWVSVTALHELAQVRRRRDLGAFRMGLRAPLCTRLIVYQGLRKGRRAFTLRGTRRRDRVSEDAARSAREPWVLATSLDTTTTAAKIVRYYARRMTIEQGFRDLKSDVFGAGFEHSLTHKGGRLANLLVLFALRQFAAWLIGLCEERERDALRLEGSRHPRRRHYSTLRLGVEILKHPLWWPPRRLLKRFLRDLGRGCPLALQSAATA
ncbi:MAG: IS4 family transposase [Rhodanobacteraceae bacterium]